MIDLETALKLQACVDGELPSSEARRVAELVEADAEARALFEELKVTRASLRGNELEFTVPASREFYWSGIRRRIEQAEAANEAPAVPEPEPWWIRFFAPAGVLAALVVLVALTLTFADRPGGNSPALAVGHQIETPLDEVSSIAFRSESAGMTVVWVDTHLN
jgi:anti-sigma factor RsiW